MENAALLPTKLEDWKAKAKLGDASLDCLLRKEFSFDEVEKLEETGDGLIRARFTITMGSVDRDNDTIAIDGWDLEDYEKNPTVLWAHDYYGTPIPTGAGIGITTLGLSEELSIIGGRMKSVVVFQPRDLNPFAYTIASLVTHTKRWIRAASVGLKPKQYAWNTERGGVDFMLQKLLEWSICPIGCHPDALSEAKSLGIELSPLRQWAEQALASADGEGSWVPKAHLEAVARIVSGEKIISIPRLAFAEMADDEVKTLVGSEALQIAAIDGETRTIAAAGGDEAAEEDPHVLVQRAIDAVTKAGRVLSAANETRIRGAATKNDDAKALLDEVLRQLDAQDEEEDKGAHGAADDHEHDEVERTVATAAAADAGTFTMAQVKETVTTALNEIRQEYAPAAVETLSFESLKASAAAAGAALAAELKADHDNFITQTFGRLPD